MTTSGPQDSPTLILCHGAGSSADFLARAFPSASCRCRTVYLEDRTGSVPRMVDALRDAIRDLGPSPGQVFVGGVSIGAHAAALLAGEHRRPRIDGCVFVMPAWTGTPPQHSSAAVVAEEINADGAVAVLDRLGRDPATRDDWVFDELRRAWRSRPTLGSELAVAASGDGPTAAHLASIAVPSLIVALRDDPVHPLGVARAWQSSIPFSRLVALERSAPSEDRSIFGAQVAGWLAALNAPR